MFNALKDKTTWILPLLLAMTLFALPASALDLRQAKSQGMVGETPSGYLGAVKPSPAVNSLINDINAKRKAAYQNIAKKNGTPLSTVEQLAGKKAIDETPGGQYVFVGGKWVRK